jgi:hypothetical protein
MKEVWMGRTCSTHGRDERGAQSILQNCLGDKGVDERLILKWFLKK